METYEKYLKINKIIEKPVIETKKSLFVGKLIGLGVLKKDGDKLVKNKEWDNERVKKELKKKITPRKVVHKVKKILK